MVKKVFQVAFSVWLSILLLFGTTPKEFIHLFADHNDTVEQYHSGKLQAIEKQHHHCQFLGFVFAPFVSDAQMPVLCLNAPFYFVKHIVPDIHFVQRSIVRTSLRGPPAV